jgi:hypothetical protein
MGRELSDAEVFGSAPAELSDAEVFGLPRKALPAGYPTVQPAKRTLAERFADNAEEGRRQTIFGAGADALNANVPGSKGAYLRERNQDEESGYRLRSETDPWYQAPGGIPGKAVAGLATLGGLMTGGLTSPEALIGPGKTMAGRIIGNAAVNAVTDVPVQMLQNAAGTHEGFDPVRVAAAGASGAVVQGGAEGLAVAAKAGGRAIKRVVDGVRSKRATTAPAGELSDAEVFGAPPKGATGGPELSDAEVFGGTVAPAAPKPTPAAPPKPAAMTPEAASAMVREILPGARITSGYRTPEHNAAVHGVPNSYHTRGQGQAVDIAPPKGTTLAQFRAALEARGVKVAELIDEGDHWHLAWEIGSGAGSRPTASEPAPDFLPDVPEQSLAQVPQAAQHLGAPDLGDRGNVEVDFAHHGPAGPADRQAADAGGAPSAGLGDEARSVPSGGGRFLDEGHARLYDFGQRALRGEPLDQAEANALFRDVGQYFDWTDHDLSPRERRILRQEGRVTPERMIAAAKDFARDYDAPEGGGPHLSYYDPERLSEVMTAASARVAQPVSRPLPPFPETLDLTPDNGPLSGASPANVEKRAGIDLSSYDVRQPARGGNVTAARPSSARALGEGSTEYARQTVSQLADRLRKTLGLTHRQGRITGGRRVLGEFDPRSGVVRTRAAKDAVDHLAHEAGHKLQHMRNGALDAAISHHGPELDQLAYAGANPAHIREEGFAEFFRAYLLNPAEAKLRAPNFYPAFEAAMVSDNPRTAKDLGDIQAAYGALLHGAALDVASASIAYTGKPPPIRGAIEALKEHGPGKALLGIMDEAYRGIWDRKHPFNVFMRQVQALAKSNTGRRLNIEAAQNPYVLSRMGDHAFAQAQGDLMNGVTPYHGVDPEGPSLKEINARAFGNHRPSDEESARFDAYLVARRMIHEWDRFHRGELENAPDKIEQDKAFHERVIEDAEALHPDWREAAEMAHAWNANMWRLWHEAGFIGQETYERGLSDHQDYVPLMRDMSDRQAPGGGGSRGRGIGQFAGGVDAFVGSSRDIVSPMVSMVRRAFEVRAAIARNEVIRTMKAAAEAAGDDHGRLIEVLPAKQGEMIKVDAMEALKAVAKAMGLDERDRSAFEVFQTMELEGAIQAEIFRQIEFSPRRDEAVVFLWKGGKKTPLLLPDGKLGRDLFTAISGMTKDTRALWEEIAAGAAQALRLGVTGVPEFAVKTTMRDQMAAAILTDVGFVPYLDAVRGFAAEARHTPLAKRYQAMGGLKGGLNVQATRRPFPRNDAEAKAQLRRYQHGGLHVQSWRDVMHIVDIGDTATRVGVYAKAEKRALGRGLNPYSAAVEARHTSADFFDPSRHGAWAGVIQAARVIPFFNSGLQGPDVAVRVVRHAFQRPETLQDKAKFRRAWWALSLFGATAMLGATIVVANHDDPDFQNINDATRGTHWPMMKRRNGEWLLYPKSFELGMPSNLTERILGWFLERDPHTLERIGKDILNTTVPTRDAPILAVPVQAMRNRDRNGRPIIPDNLKGEVAPQFEVNPWTSETAKLLAGDKVSPALLEHYVNGFLGSAGRDALSLGDMAVNAARGAPAIKPRAPDTYLTRGYVRRTARGSDAEEQFWKVAGQEGAYEKQANTLRLIAKQGDDAAAEAYLARLPKAARDYAASQVLIGGKLAKSNPLVRARLAMGVISDLRQENRKGVLVGAGNRPIRMTPEQRRTVDDALDDLALAEAHNALVASGLAGERSFMDRRAAIARIAKVAPPLAQALNQRMIEAGVLPIQAAAQMWASTKATIAGLSPAETQAFLRRSRMNSTLARRAEVRRLATDPKRSNPFAGGDQPKVVNLFATGR